MKSSFFSLLNEYRIPICYLHKNAACQVEEKIELERLCHSLPFTVSHSFLEPDDAFFFPHQITMTWKMIFQFWQNRTKQNSWYSYFEGIMIATLDWLILHPSQPLVSLSSIHEKLRATFWSSPQSHPERDLDADRSNMRKELLFEQTGIEYLAPLWQLWCNFRCLVLAYYMAKCKEWWQKLPIFNKIPRRQLSVSHTSSFYEWQYISLFFLAHP